jgi:hypothetical protein
MNQPSDDPPVKPDLFTELEKYAKTINAKSAKDESVPSDLQAFCMAFFQQFLTSAGLPLTGINDPAKEAAIRKRIALGNDSSTLPVRRLLLMFQDLCDQWPDIELGSYVPNESLYRQFHTTYMPRLLTRIKDWVEASHYDQLTGPVSSALAAFQAASAKL